MGKIFLRLKFIAKMVLSVYLFSEFDVFVCL